MMMMMITFYAYGLYLKENPLIHEITRHPKVGANMFNGDNFQYHHNIINLANVKTASAAEKSRS